MHIKQILEDGEISQVSFGIVFVVIEGFSIKDDVVIRWWLRIDKELLVETGEASYESIDVGNKIFEGAIALASLCGQVIQRAVINSLGITLYVAGGKNIAVIWEEGESSSAHFEASIDREDKTDFIVTLNMPDDLYIA